MGWFKYLIVSLISISQLYAEGAGKCGPQVKEAIRRDPLGVSVSSDSCPLAHKVIKWLQLQKEGTFTEIKAFLDKNPKWPRQQALCKKAEESLAKDPQSSADVLAWFKVNPPLTAEGLTALAKVLHDGGEDEDRDRLRQAFYTVPLDVNELSDVLVVARDVISKDDLFKRASLSLARGEKGIAHSILIRLDGKHRSIIDARLKISENHPQAEMAVKKLGDVDDPGLAFEQIRRYRKDQQDEKALKLVDKLKEEGGHLDLDVAWTERNILARRFIEEGHYEKAYKMVDDHGLIRGENFANAEWLAGWLALRFMKDPEKAKLHFQKLHDNVGSPISVARAAYWLGRAYKQAGEKEEAAKWFKKAKSHPATYYGQLAQKELSGSIPAIKPAKLSIDEETRRQFEKQEMVRVIRMFLDLGETGMAEIFSIAVAEDIQNPKEQALLVQMAEDFGGKHAAVQIYKKTIKSEAPVIPAAYPRVGLPIKHVESAFAHAIIRQESRFKSDAVSSAGATGLMQLMPATAQRTMKANKIKKGKLTDPRHNVNLGTLHLRELMDKYGGSMVLTAAAYNAGSTPVATWIAQNGDPRDKGVDQVDWVEQIPYAETRNYVQRVMENYHCYR